MLPPLNVMRRAFADKDPAYDGVFFVAIKSTGIFCRPVCKARAPRPEHVQFYASAQDAIRAGFRPCLRCRPLQAAAQPPAAVQRLMALLDQDPSRRLKDADLAAIGLDPSTSRRQFRSYCGTTFHQYQRARRMGEALATLQAGGKVIEAQLDGGYESGSGFRAAFQRMFGDAPAADAQLEVLRAARFETPLGPMLGIASERGICLCDFLDRKGLQGAIGRLCESSRAVLLPGSHPHLQALGRYLHGYFDGRCSECKVPLDLRLGTAFQRRAWEFLTTLACGQTCTYQEQACALGQPGAARAAGAANGMNYLAILIPCHRVVGARGALTGYGGGIARKQWLLEHEAHSMQQRSGVRSA